MSRLRCWCWSLLGQSWVWSPLRWLPVSRASSELGLPYSPLQSPVPRLIPTESDIAHMTMEEVDVLVRRIKQTIGDVEANALCLVCRVLPPYWVLV